MEADHLTADIMAEQADEPQDFIPDESQPQEQEVVVDQDVELDIEALREKAAKADEYKKYADRVTAENKKLKKSSPTNESSQDADERFERLELKTEGYNSDEVDFLMQNGGKRALDNSIVIAGIEAIRAKVKSKNATPSGTGKSAVYQKFGERDLKNMSLSDLEKIIPQD